MGTNTAGRAAPYFLVNSGVVPSYSGWLASL